MLKDRFNNITNVVKKRIASLFSAPMGGLYMVLFAIAIGVATFIENDFGTSAAQKHIFKAYWFELLLLLFGISILFNVNRFKLVKQKKWATLAFHLSFLLILLGAAITRYFGSEGTMHIREGDQSNTILSAEPYLLFKVAKNGKQYEFEEPVLFSSLGKNKFNESYLIDNQELNVELLDIVPNPKEQLIDDENGVPILQVVIAGNNGREEYLLKFGDRTNIYGTLFNFGNAPAQDAFNIYYERDSLFFSAPTVYTQMRMATQESDTLTPDGKYPLFLRSMYASEGRSFVFGMFTPNGSAKLTSTSSKISSTSQTGLNLQVSISPLFRYSSYFIRYSLFSR